MISLDNTFIHPVFVLFVLTTFSIHGVEGQGQNRRTCDQGVYTLVIPEDLRSLSVIANFSSIGEEWALSASQSWVNDLVYLQTPEKNGEPYRLRSIDTIDYEKVLYHDSGGAVNDEDSAFFSVIMNCTVKKRPKLSIASSLTIVIRDVDDLPPVFYHFPTSCKHRFCAERVFTYTAEMPHNYTGVLTNIRPSQIFAVDGDFLNYSITYTIVDESHRNAKDRHVVIDPVSATVNITQAVNQEHEYVVFKIIAEEQSSIRRSSVAYLFVYFQQNDMDELQQNNNTDARTSSMIAVVIILIVLLISGYIIYKRNAAKYGRFFLFRLWVRENVSQISTQEKVGEFGQATLVVFEMVRTQRNIFQLK